MTMYKISMSDFPENALIDRKYYHPVSVIDTLELRLILSSSSKPEKRETKNTHKNELN